MKALIISDDDSIVSPIDEYLQNNQFNTIIYRWMIKAIDNIEEIRPDLIVISAAEYPRHWKTLVQFVKSGIGGKDVKIFLYEPYEVSAADLDKAKELQVTYFNSLDEITLKKLVTPFFPEGQILFNHPVNNCIYSAQLVRRTEKRLQFRTDFAVPSLNIADKLNKITLCINDCCDLFCGTIVSIQNNLITLEVQE